MDKVRKIGIYKDIGIILFVFSVGLIISVVVSGIFFAIYFSSDYKSELLNKYGIEVEAEIIGYHRVSEGGDDIHNYNYETEYRFIAQDGSVYKGTDRIYGSESQAIERVGDKLIITIVPNSNISSPKRYSDLTKHNYELHLAMAILFAILTPVSAYFLIYRGIYRNELDKKIIVGLENNNLSIKQGEVKKVVKWIVCYVKVEYKDENGNIKEKWARSWFTHKEAKFLQNKKTINIVPYKNTYGILEETSAN